MSVSMKPGATQLTVMPRLPISQRERPRQARDAALAAA